MTSEQPLSEIFSESLVAVEQDESTVEACLAIYPHFQDELSDLFRAAGTIRSAPQIRPDAAFRANAKIRLLNQVAAMQVHARPLASPAQPAPNGRPGLFAPGRRTMAWAAGLLLCLLAVFFAGGSLAYAALNSLPGESLYGVKLWANDFQVRNADLSRQAELHIQFANAHLTEMQYLAVELRYADLNVAAANFEDQILQAAAAITSLQHQDPAAARAMSRHLELTLTNHAQVLRGMLVYVPSSARSAIQHAIEVTDQTVDPGGDAWRSPPRETITG